MRSFGGSPAVTKPAIVLFRFASSLAALATSPPGPVIWAYWLWASCWGLAIWPRTAWVGWVSAAPVWTSDCLADRSSGDLDSVDQAFQNFDSLALMPLSPGSASESSTLSSAPARPDQSLRFVFWPRYWASRNWSRTRRKLWTSTPEPRNAPVCIFEPETCTGSAAEAASVASWREEPCVDAL